MMTTESRTALKAWLLILGLSAGISSAVDLRLGEEFQVNTYTTNPQREPGVASNAGGDFVVVWASEGSSGSDNSDYSIQGQRYASDGSPVGGEFQVNTYTTDKQGYPEVAVADNGDFVVVWQSDGSAGADQHGKGILGQRFGSDGFQVGGEFQINGYTFNDQQRPAVGIESEGDFVVVWVSQGSFGDDHSAESIQGRRYASDGTDLGGSFQVNTYITSTQRQTSVAVDPSGAFVVAWESYGSPGTDSYYASIQAQRYASDGAEVGNQFQVNSFTLSRERSPRVATDASGDFLVVWESSGSQDPDPSGASIRGRRYASSGGALGEPFQVNTFTTGSQRDPVVAAGAGGNFIVAWAGESAGTDMFSSSIQARAFDADGFPFGNDQQVNTYTLNNQNSPAIAGDAQGTFVATWYGPDSGGTDTSELSAQAQRLSVPLFADGFESGDTSAW